MKTKLYTLIVLMLAAGGLFAVKAQSQVEAMKAEAVREMKVGRYGEAIDLLNRYISARPQQAEGYNLRGLCYEQRQQFELSVYDFRSARKLEPDNKEINANLSRATNTWYTLLYNDIEGYKREIAINPSNPENYLNVGKCYKNLGKWPIAEEWYDKYLTMAHASPDEIIRYSEILAKTGHIAKGWPILKRYTEEYPNDQRLWSRFGYFSLWLGKNKIAIEAFENALALKPYFKEAMDGLDQAKGKGYIYTVNDTSYRHYNYGLPPKRPEFVYPIDRYYRILKRRPDDNATRLELVKALYKVDRFEEASQQIALLQQSQYDSVEVAQLANNIDSVRTIVYQQRIQEYKAKFAADSANKEVVLNLGQYYSQMQDYDSALAVYATYLNKSPGDEQVLFNYAKAEANNRQFFRAKDKMQTLLKMSPDNLKYQLFLAQLDVWTGQDLDTAKVYLNNVLSNEPNNLGALVAISSLSMRQNDFTAAQGYMDQIKTINPDYPELKSLESSLTMNKFRYKEEQNYALLQQAEDLYNAGKCEDALPLYQQFLKNSPDNSLIEKEYADVNVCAGHYQNAIDIYNDLLNKGYDFNIDYSRATAYYAMGDSVQALDNFQRLAKANPDNFNVNLYLGDAYIRMHEYDKARDVYENMQDKMKLDSTQNAMVEQRYTWMPVTGFRGILSSFPQYTLITPYASYYQDNLGVRNNIQGLRIDVGVTSFLTVGAEGFRTSLTSNAAQVNSNTIRWDLTLRLMDALTLGVNFGNNNYGGTYTQPVADIILRSEVAHKYSAYATFSKLDASQIIYSPYLIGVRINANMYRLGGSYQWKSGLRLASDYSYYSFSDGNQGYNFSFRIGKYFYPDFILGYEYYTGGFQRTSYLYFSPQTYSSHNLWAEWDLIHDTTTTVTLGGLIGFIGNSNYILRSAYVAATFRLFERLTLQGRIAGGSSVQNYTGYSSFGATISAYWSL